MAEYYGPIVKALERLDEAGKKSLIEDLKDVTAQASRPVEEACELPSAYLEVVGSVLV
ncbi:MAG: hypothetical protein U5R14_09885 [Gemmatimonadota bacterium]|nr:hypothetical protein [Gemmatimonadota bacterium]